MRKKYYRPKLWADVQAAQLPSDSVIRYPVRKEIPNQNSSIMIPANLRISTDASISFKALHEYFHTPDEYPNIQKRKWKHECPIPLMYFTLYKMAVQAANKDSSAGRYKCHECSAERGTPVYHGNTNYFAQFREKYGKFFPMLEKVQKEYI